MNTKLVLKMCRELIDKEGSVTAAAEVCGIERTMFNRIVCQSRDCGISVATAKKIRDAYEACANVHVSLDELYS